MLTSPKFLAGVLSGVAVGAAGSTFYLLSDRERSLELRKKVATYIRDAADKAIENLDRAADEVQDTLEGSTAQDPMQQPGQSKTADAGYSSSSFNRNKKQKPEEQPLV